MAFVYCFFTARSRVLRCSGMLLSTLCSVVRYVKLGGIFVSYFTASLQCNISAAAENVARNLLKSILALMMSC